MLLTTKLQNHPQRNRCMTSGCFVKMQMMLQFILHYKQHKDVINSEYVHIKESLTVAFNVSAIAICGSGLLVGWFLFI